MDEKMYVNGHKVDISYYMPPPTLLATAEEYDALSPEDIKDRYLYVLNHQLSKASYFSKKVKLPSDYLAEELTRFASSSGIMEGIDSHATKQKEVELARNVVRF